MRMPKVSLDTLTPDQFKIAKGIIATRGKNKGALRASKPKVERHIDHYEHFDLPSGPYDSPVYEPDFDQGCTAYVWRWVAFHVSGIRQHQCLPMCADMDLPGRWSETKELREELDKIVDAIVNETPVNEWQGILTWKQAFGL